MSDEYYLLSEKAKRYVHIGWVNMAGVTTKHTNTMEFLKETMENGWHDVRLVYDQEIYVLFESSDQPYLELKDKGIWSDERYKI